MRTMHKAAVGFAALILAGSGLTPAASAAPSSTSVSLSTVRATILQQTNAQRTAAGLRPLVSVKPINTTAQICSERQAAARKMFHCAAPADFGRAWAENVASGQRYDQVVAAWMASPGHRANILNPRYTHLGIGYMFDSAGRTYFTQNFQLPR